MKLLIEESGSAEAATLWSAASIVWTGRITYAESRAALARARRDGRLSSRDLTAAKERLESRLERMGLVEARGDVVRVAGDLAERRRLRAYDAIHLASALALRNPRLVVGTFDIPLRHAAAAEGLATAPGQG